MSSDKITVSDKAKAMNALFEEFKALEQEQLDIGEKMGSLIIAQVRCAEKCRIIHQAMEKLFGE